MAYGSPLDFMRPAEKVPIIVLPDEPGPVALPSAGATPPVFVSLTPNHVSFFVATLALLNAVLALLLTTRAMPAWFDLRGLGSELDAALMVGTLHVGVSCCAILFAGRRLFRRHGLSGRLYAMAGAACLATAFALGRYWTHPVELPAAVPPPHVTVTLTHAARR